MLLHPENATYTHTLTVSGRLVGEYECNVSNIRTPSSSRNLTVEGELVYFMRDNFCSIHTSYMYVWGSDQFYWIKKCWKCTKCTAWHTHIHDIPVHFTLYFLCQSLKCLDHDHFVDWLIEQQHILLKHFCILSRLATLLFSLLLPYLHQRGSCCSSVCSLAIK